VHGERSGAAERQQPVGVAARVGVAEVGVCPAGDLADICALLAQTLGIFQWIGAAAASLDRT
jgi:hypothetical protein